MERVVALGALGIILFGYPVMAVFDDGPVALAVYLFVAWALFIALVAALARTWR